MRLVTFTTDGAAGMRCGLETDHGIADASAVASLAGLAQDAARTTRAVLALSDDERASITDPRVIEMISRAETVSPEQITALHGRVTMRDPRAGEASALGLRPGDHVTLHPRANADLAARMLEGRRATIERIYVDTDDKTYFAVTVDDDPGQDLMRETGRYLFFFESEVQA